MNIQAFLNDPKTRKSYGNKSGLYAGCFITTYSTAFSLSSTRSRSWQVCRPLPAHSKHIEPIHHHCLQCTCSTTESTHPPMNFGQVGILPLQETESLPYGPVWMDSPPGTPSLSCAVQSSTQAIHPVNCTVLNKCVSVYLPSQMCSCAIYTAMAALQSGFN
jgi:hypothetical protein